jgi:hypothetical protein
MEITKSHEIKEGKILTLNFVLEESEGPPWQKPCNTEQVTKYKP